MDFHCDLLITGGGSLSTELLYALSSHREHGLTCAIACRDIKKAAWLSFSANARARIAGSEVCFAPFRLEWDDPGLDALLASARPRLVVQLASLQSPWSIHGRWKRMIQTHGFGITTPRQAILTLAMARAIQRSASPARLINGCYPDFVNQIVAGLSLPLTCGLGNISILDAVLRETLGLAIDAPLQIVAHHYHMSNLNRAPDRRDAWPLVWLDGVRLDDLPRRLAALRLPPGHEINRITAVTILPSLFGLLGLADCRINLAAPDGLPGGFPVRIEQGEITLDVPMPLAEAIAFNKRCEILEGVEIGSDAVRWAPAAAAELQAIEPRLNGVFPFDDLLRRQGSSEALEALVARLSDEP
jgi:hypothetical protein